LTNREKNLLIVFFAVLAAALLMVAADSYLGKMARLNEQFISLEQRTLRVVQSSSHSVNSGDTSSLLDLKKRFYAPGTLPAPLSLAALAETTLKTAGLTLVESRITESSTKAQWVKYSVEGDIGAWFRFLQQLRRQDPQTLFRSLSMIRKSGYHYAISFEVGHVVVP